MPNNVVFLEPKEYDYHYDLKRIQDFVIENNGIWEYDDPPTGLVVYLAGTEVHIGNDYPYIEFKGDISIALKVHHAGKYKK